MSRTTLAGTGHATASWRVRRSIRMIRFYQQRGVAKWYRARFGTARPEVRSLSPRRVGRRSSPVQTTSGPALLSAGAEDPQPGNNWIPGRATCRAVHLGVMAVLQTACGRCNPDARYEHPAVAQQQSTWLITAGSLGQNQPAGRWASSSMENACLISGMLRVQILRGLRDGDRGVAGSARQIVDLEVRVQVPTIAPSSCSLAWLKRLSGGQEIARSNRVSSTKGGPVSDPHRHKRL